VSNNNTKGLVTYAGLGLLLVIPALHLSAQKKKPATGKTPHSTIAGCYGANGTDVRESLCLFEKHRFLYARSYGAVDQLGKGTWIQHKDTVFITSDNMGPKFKIRNSVDEKVPAGKLQLLFAFSDRFIPSIVYGFTTDSSGLDTMQLMTPKGRDTEQGVVVTIDQPVGAHLLVQHQLFDKTFFDYVIPAGTNSLVIEPGEGIGRPEFKGRAYILKGKMLVDVEMPEHVLKYGGKITEELRKLSY
jgi:hypothetical protein